mgnify:CR=1 FL=1
MTQNPTSRHTTEATPWFGSDRGFWIVCFLALLWKSWAAASLGLIFDECYYWVWSLHPQACYFDHPPLVAWVIAGGRALLRHTEAAVRLGAILSGLLLALAGRALATELFGRSAGNRAGILLTLAPVFAGNSFLMTPDTLLAPAWAFALLFAWRGLQGSSAWWIASGAAAGIGLLSKYTMVLFFAGLGLLWVVSPGKRGRMFWGGLVAAVTALIFFSPVLWWNATHGWSSFAHQIHHGFRNEQRVLIHLDFLADYALFLVVLVSPVLGLLCFRSAATRLADERFRFLGAFFWTVILFFGYAAAKAHVEANWPMMAFVSALVMVSGDWERYVAAWRKAAVIVLLITDLAAVIALSLLLLRGHALLPSLSTPPNFTWLARITGSERLATGARDGASDLQARLSEILGPKEVARAVSLAFKDSGADFLCADTYQTHGVLCFYAPELEPVLWLPIKGRARFPWIDEQAFAGKRGLTAEWPRSGCHFGWLFEKTLWSKKIWLPGIARPITLTLNEGYDPRRVKEE